MSQKNEKFPLPGTSYPLLSGIIKAYFAYGGESIDSKNLSAFSLGKIIATDIPRNSNFLEAIGVLEKTQRGHYKLTPRGFKLGSAIYNNDVLEISQNWRSLVEKHSFFEKVLKSIRINSHVAKSILKEYIVTSAGEKVTRHRFDTDALTIINIMEEANLIDEDRKTIKIKSQSPEDIFINLDIIIELETTKSQFDCARLIRYCEELNDNYKRGNYASVGFLSRAIVDHIPPIFNQKSFASLASQTSGERHNSFKKSCESLDKSLKNIVDRSIHKQINSIDIPPFKEEINFSQDLNTVLARVVEELQTTWIVK